MIPVFSARHCVLPLLSVVATRIPGHAGGWHLRRKPCVVLLPCLFPYLILPLLIYARSVRQLSTNFSYDDLDLSGSDQFTIWGLMTPDEVLTEHVVDIHRIEADFRDAFERNQSSSSSQSYGVNNGDRIHHSKEERKLFLRSNRVNHQRLRSTSLLMQMETMKSLKMNLEPLQLPNLLDQYIQIFLVMKTVSTAMNTVHKVRTLEGQYPIPNLHVLTNDEHWTMTLATHKYAEAAESFAFQSLKMENNKMYAI